MSRFDSSIFRSKRRIAGLTVGLASAAAVIAVPALTGGGVANAQLVAHVSPAQQIASNPDLTGPGGEPVYQPTPVAKLIATPVATLIAKPKPVGSATTTNSSERASRSTTRRSLPSSSSGSPTEIAQSMLAARGWSGQFSCLNSLWSKESGWRVSASNPSGAYGIPQALPGSKMASAGSDWQTNPATQITWGLNYISSTYGSPCAAWSHSQSNNWY